MASSRVYYGGQAVLEGVMMRGRAYVSVAVRAPDGQIVLRSEPLPRRLYAGFVGRTPFLRGLTMLWDSLGLGMKALMFSADVASEGEGAEMPRSVRWTSVATAMLFGVGIFFVLPVLLATFIEGLTGSALLAHSVEAIVRLLLLIGYVGLIGLLPDIRRVYAYHGAEHMTIHAFEAGDPLDPEHVGRYNPAHPRCGTAFLLLVVAISILVFALVGSPTLPLRLLSRILLIPVIAGIAYEILKIGGAHHDHPLVRPIVWPGLALQRLTTRYPDESQMEVAIAAFQEMRAREAGAAAGATAPRDSAALA
ncbi:MAG: DUF1385 domain-containing protein [Chloroflexi bacterium]|nr:DUF1385 domain-containing protein [Chloroflexota bacterium]